ncbi:hypothetical protein GCM10009682_63430 [Luedemannella flava]|uniref:Type II secretion system protein GspF domain-containing protein n=1 Tax=Luedemannella flava TaxID=349316 RepID=A0ABP4Z266_9ACTN
MTGLAWVAAAIAVVALLLLVTLPGRVRRARWRALARRLNRTGNVDEPAVVPASRPERGSAVTRVRARLADLAPGGVRRVAVVTALAGGGLVAATVGPVAGVVVGVYAAVGSVAAARTARAKVAARRFDRAVDGVATLAAELRAGVPAEVAVRDCAAELTRDVGHRVAAAVTLAERTGAPLAAVLDRLDQQLRAALRLRSTVAAQAAGARASAWLLAVLPLAGVALGPVMGVSPGAVLLGTPLGAGCLLGAVALQLGGLAWAARLARPRGVTP